MSRHHEAREAVLSARPRQLCGVRCAAAAITFAVLFLSTPAHAFRTTADEFGFSSPAVWPMDVELYLDLSAFRNEERVVVRQAVLRAVDRWNAVPCASVAIRVIGSGELRAQDGLNTLAWVRDWSERGLDPEAVGTTDAEFVEVRQGQWRISEVDVLLNNADHRWSTSREDVEGARAIEAVVTHELGHLLGLSHPCGDPGAPSCETDESFILHTMHPEYRGIRQADLSAEDVRGLCSLYPAEAECSSNGDCGQTELCKEGFCIPACDDVDCGAALCIHGACEASPCGDVECCSARDCSPGEYCNDGRCTRQLTDGEPCEEAGSCRSGQCDGSCIGDEPCESGSCGLFGQSCEMGADCESRVCLTSSDAANLCTRQCGEGNDCPRGFECAPAEGLAASVCIPRSNGCSAGGRAPSFSLVLALLFTVTRKRLLHKEIS